MLFCISPPPRFGPAIGIRPFRLSVVTMICVPLCFVAQRTSFPLLSGPPVRYPRTRPLLAICCCFFFGVLRPHPLMASTRLQRLPVLLPGMPFLRPGTCRPSSPELLKKFSLCYLHCSQFFFVRSDTSSGTDGRRLPPIKFDSPLLDSGERMPPV